MQARSKLSGRCSIALAGTIILLWKAIAGGQDLQAATLTVTTTADSGAGSLRNTIAAASDGDLIHFAAALNGQTIGLTSAELLINKNLTITGPGPTQLAVSRASGTFRIFHILPGHTAVIEDLKISGGFSHESGGGVFNEQATLTLNHCTVEGNYSGGSGGGGIYSFGGSARLTVLNSSVNSNLNNGVYFGSGGAGAGIYSDGTLTITNSSVSGNSVTPQPPRPGTGGGIVSSGPLEITNSWISGNTGGYVGGGLICGGSTTITNSIIVGNTSIAVGGGISNGGTLTIINSTISENTAVYKNGGTGGGISSGNNATLTITNSTLSGNRADYHGGGIDLSSGTLHIANTILKKGTQGANISTVSGSVISHGYNLSNDNGGGFLTATGDLINTDPLLGPLQDNGGPTATYALLTGSPALNAGDPGFAPPPFYDQRGPGYDRVSGGRLDIGSFEVQPTFLVTTTADSGAGSLRDTIAAVTDGEMVQFSAALNGRSIILTSAELVVDKNMTISGPGAALLSVSRGQQAPAFRVFRVTAGHTVAIEGLTISDGLAQFGGGVVNDHSTLTIRNCIITGNGLGFGNGGGGGGIYNDGEKGAATLAIVDSTISNNSAGDGGGIYNKDGLLTLTNSSVTDNSVFVFTGGYANLGSGGGIYNTGTLEIANSTLSKNFANRDGGGISGGGSMTIINSTLTSNSAGPTEGIGGGICNFGALTITNSTLSNNGAGASHENVGMGSGGAIFNGGTVEIISSTLNSNGASSNGGAIASFATDTTLTIINSTLSGNSAAPFYLNESRGGAISNGGTLEITNSTLHDNSAESGGAIYNSATGGLGNTILNASGGGSIVSNSGTVTSHGYNLSSDNGGGVLNGSGDQINTNPALGPLQDNGGPTFTHELLLGSPAIDTGDPSFTPPPLHDQRGYARVFSNRIDIGSLEVQVVPTPTPTATPTATPTVTATATVSPTPTATPTPTAPTQSLNLSSRMLVQTGDRIGIAGLIIAGGAPKRVIVRTVHCMICVPEVFPLTDPVLELHGPNGFVTLINDNWRDTQEAEIIATGLVPDNNSDSAIVVTLSPGNYTAIVRGKNNSSGVALVEVYDLSQAAASKLANISTRAFVSTGGNILIAGFILGNGTRPDNVIVRGIGPSLTGLGVPDVLADPTLELRDSNGALIRANDSWMADPAQRALIMAAGLAPTNPLESAIAETLPPGQYTALLDGVNNGTGNGLVEVYNLGP